MTDFWGKRVGVIGAGVENAALVPWLVRQKAKVVVTDEKRKEDLESVNKLHDLPIEWRLGPHYLDHLSDFDVLIKTPGARPATRKKIDEAAGKGVEVTTQTNIFFEHCPAHTVGVTGTKGKGTTASLIYEMLKAAGFRVFLGGNIGNPPVTFLDELTPSSWVVLELSSFQLEDLFQSPHIAVVLSITPDHLDIHPSFQEYLEAKKHLVRYQSPQDYAVLLADNVRTMEFAVETPGELHYVSREKAVEQGAYVVGDRVVLRERGKESIIAKANEVQLVGRHNLENIAAASVAAYLAGAPLSAIRKAARSFPGLPHRLQLVGEFGGVKYYNDSFGTTPATAIAAIQSFRNPITLIVGGSSKKADFRELGELIAKKSTVNHVILLGSAEAPKIRAAIESHMDRQQEQPDFYPVMSMDAAVKTAVKLAKPGEVVLLSPAAASFDLFSDYKDRGTQFTRAVHRHAS